VPAIRRRKRENRGMASIGRAAILALAVSLAAYSAADADQPAAPDLLKRGEYLARVGDCFACHTQAGHPSLSGGRQLETPYGTISSPNITPDQETGIGKWSDDDFYKLMHDGIGKSGEYIYPVMPFDHYTKVTRDDVMAIEAYLFSVPPVHAPRPPSHMAFPFTIREGLAAWRALYFSPGTFKPDLSMNDQQNRGAYLVEGLGHCGSCHTPRNIAMGSITSEALGGGEIKGQGWFAPNITSDVREGIGAWSDKDLVQYLKTGVAPGHAVTAGPMAETIHDSLRYVTDADLQAIASFLKATPGKALYSEQQPSSPPGATAYLNNCAFCHQPNGQGIAGAVPPLAGNGAVLAGGAEDVIRTILGGLPAQGPYAAMPGFAQLIPSADIAGIANYVRDAFGNKAPANATTRLVDELGRTTSTMWSGTGDCAPVAPALATALKTAGLDDALHNINAGNMIEHIDGILPKLHAADATLGQADEVNGLTAAYCPIVMGETSLDHRARILLLQQFGTLVYSRLTSHDLSSAMPAQHAGNPPAATPN
jgi:mono/diheme cytochrome c family protein